MIAKGIGLNLSQVIAMQAMQGVGAVRRRRIWLDVYVRPRHIDGAIVVTVDGEIGNRRLCLLEGLRYLRKLVRVGGDPSIRHGDGLQVQNRASKVDTIFDRVIVEKERKEKERKRRYLRVLCRSHYSLRLLPTAGILGCCHR